MTPKEKAEELYGKFWRETPQPYIERVEFYKESKLIFNDWDKDWTNKLAKQCALIAVDEILKCVNNPDEYYLMEYSIIYWQEVKKEIQLL